MMVEKRVFLLVEFRLCVALFSRMKFCSPDVVFLKSQVFKRSWSDIIRLSFPPPVG